MQAAIQVQEKHAREDAIDEVKKRVIEHFEDEEADADTLEQVKKFYIKSLKKKYVV